MHKPNLKSQSSMPRIQSSGLSINYPALDSSVPAQFSSVLSEVKINNVVTINNRNGIKTQTGHGIIPFSLRVRHRCFFRHEKPKFLEEKKNELSLVQGNRFMG
ncbi:hypothetical protein CDAR_241571 [Caerostris darwini]|uniref:Uncharacterized protein n=1 Tax=Caerostris darwini TaxID=1538125 RepID=A0AAV4QEI3_9ARAC|nr:hypothetical protein CDAR_241571 [Caerostris darwini]